MLCTQRLGRVTMTANDDFWALIEDQLHALTTARTPDDVMRILPTVPGLSSADGFFAGSGGDGDVITALVTGGWTVEWLTASYFWCAQAPDGGFVTYIEGDLYRGRQKPLPAGTPRGL